MFVNLAINNLYMMIIFCYTAVFGWFRQVFNNIYDTLSFLGENARDEFLPSKSFIIYYDNFV